MKDTQSHSQVRKEQKNTFKINDKRNGTNLHLKPLILIEGVFLKLFQLQITRLICITQKLILKNGPPRPDSRTFTRLNFGDSGVRWWSWSSWSVVQSVGWK